MAVSNFYKNKFENKKKEECKNLKTLKISNNRIKNNSNNNFSDSKRIKLVTNLERDTSIDDSLLATESTSSAFFKYDLTKEKNSVQTTLKCWLNEYLKNSQVLYLHEQIQNISSEMLDITIIVDILNVGSNEELQYGELSAHIACVLCKNRIKIMKLSKNCNSPSSNSIVENYITKEQDFDFCSGNYGGDTICKSPEITPNIVLKSQKTKWQNKNYSRTERNRRALHNSLLLDQLEQPLITNFYPIINKIEKIIVAQPLTDTNHSFCVSIFGTDNRFKCDDVMQRWQQMKQLADIEGIKIIGFSSDGDTRLLKAMELSCNEHINSNLDDSGQTEENTYATSWTWYHMGQNHRFNTLNESKICIQDSVHIATKLRIQLLNRKIRLMI